SREGPVTRQGHEPLPHGREDGFTLAEVLVAVAILGIIVAALGAAFAVTAKDSVGVHERYLSSHDAQIASAYLANDVQSNDALVDPSCSSGPVIGFSYANGAGVASYCYSGGQLTRDFSGSPSTFVTLVGKGSAATPTCEKPIGTVVPCTSGTQPSKVTIGV